jgi:hypothetical protein
LSFFSENSVISVAKEVLAHSFRHFPFQSGLSPPIFANLHELFEISRRLA